MKDIAVAIEGLMREDVDIHDVTEFVETIHKLKNTSRIRNTDHTNILKVQELLQKTKVKINNHTSTLWELEMEAISESDQSSTSEFGY